MILEMKSPVLVAASIRAEGKPRTPTVTPITAFVKQAMAEHGLDLAVLLAVLAFIGYAAI